MTAGVKRKTGGEVICLHTGPSNAPQNLKYMNFILNQEHFWSWIRILTSKDYGL